MTRRLSAVPKAKPSPAAKTPTPTIPQLGPSWNEQSCDSPPLEIRDGSACCALPCRYALAFGSGCTLLVAGEGPRTLEEIGEILGGVTREAIRQTEEKALARPALRALFRRLEIAPDDFEHAFAAVPNAHE